jgi:hypothetical protein
MTGPRDFDGRLKRGLTEWARSRHLETDGKHGWVLPKSQSGRNYFRPEWEAYLGGKAHVWGHALNSSQAFAVNLFGPAKASSSAGLQLWNALWAPQVDISPTGVNLEFEYCGPDPNSFAKLNLGEKDQTTQIDVALEGIFKNGARRFLLVEVKLRETEFGNCRGWKVEPSQCAPLARILADPGRNCWMARNEGRKYWDALQKGPHRPQYGSIKDEACPWRGSLYQVMRNWAFGQSLVASGHAEDFKVGICVHEANEKAPVLKDPVAGQRDVRDAFNVLVQNHPLVNIRPSSLVASMARAAPEGWEEYMRSRYFTPYT